MRMHGSTRSTSRRARNTSILYSNPETRDGWERYETGGGPACVDASEMRMRARAGGKERREKSVGERAAVVFSEAVGLVEPSWMWVLMLNRGASGSEVQTSSRVNSHATCILNIFIYLFWTQFLQCRHDSVSNLRRSALSTEIFRPQLESAARFAVKHQADRCLHGLCFLL